MNSPTRPAALLLASFLAAACTALLLAPAALAASPPEIHQTAAFNVTNACATLQAEIAPGEVETTYQFEYLTQEQFENEGGFASPHTEKTPAKSIATELNSGHPVSSEVCGLSRATIYVFRVLATNSESATGGTPGEKATFATDPDGPSHELAFTFGAKTSTPEDKYPLSDPTGVAVDQSNGDVYVTDPANHRVEKFDSSGNFVLTFGREVNKTAVEHHGSESEQNLCTAASGDICQPGASGAAPGEFATPTYLAVDNSCAIHRPEPLTGTACKELDPSSGDVYVADPGDGLVQKLDSSAHIVSNWGSGGIMSGEGIFLGPFGSMHGIAVNSSGDLYVDQETFFSTPVFNPEGKQIGERSTGSIDVPAGQGGIAVDSAGVPYISPSYVYVSRNFNKPLQVTSDSPTFGLAFDPFTGDLYQDTGTLIDHYSAECIARQITCSPEDSFASGELFGSKGVAVDGATGTVYVANSAANDIAALEEVTPKVTTGPPTDVTETTVTLAGHVDPENHGKEHGEIVECYFEWGTSKTYGHTTPCAETHFPTARAVTAELSGLTPRSSLPIGTTYHYRLVAYNQKGAVGRGIDQTAATTSHPQIEGVSSSHLTATTADLEAAIVPEGLATKYHFQYGTTNAYSQTTPVVELNAAPEALFSSHSVQVPIAGLQSGATYHFRLVAENALGTVTSEDQTFGYFPPACPNSAVRQQTSSAYLPDCRAYELASPGNANGTLLYPGGPSTGEATSPSRFAYVGLFGAAVPGAPIINTVGDLYVATRTDTGWVSHYVGLPGNEAGCVSGPPNDFWSNHGTIFGFAQDKLPTNPSMSRILDFRDGSPLGCASSGYGINDTNYPFDPASNAPYLWSAEGSLLGRLPTDLQTLPGASSALECPGGGIPGYTCNSDVAASGDLNHFAFSSNSLSFAAGGVTQAPGSAYDDNRATGAVTLISKLPGGAPIPQPQPDNAGSQEFIRFPAVSADGSRILMSTATARTGCKDATEACPRFTETPIHLYLSVDDLVTKDISVNQQTGENVAVHYVGTAEEGAKVFFTSEEHLTEGVQGEENPGHVGTSLYMWSEKGEEEVPPHPLTLISKANPGSPAGAGNTGSCSPAVWTRQLTFNNPVETGPWTEKCDVVPYSNWLYENTISGSGGNGHSDTAIASANGDIYFFSPEQLDGNRGYPGLENLYDYRQGRLQFVASFNPANTCAIKAEGVANTGMWCSEGPIARMQVTPNDAHMAFVTPDRLTSYDNTDVHGSCQTNVGGEPTGETHCTEMYSYDPSTENIVCDSCNPSGQPPTSDVYASQDGLFLTADGRTFFSTEEALVPTDTNDGTDVYEYVDGRPRLISSGTGLPPLSKPGKFEENSDQVGPYHHVPGLIGVSANGTDVYFSTYDTLISEDHNGDFLKFYDARANGGFLQPTPVQPCTAAEECHGPGTEAPSLPHITSNGPSSTGGNATPGSHNHHHKKHKNRKRAHKRGGKK